MVSFLPMRRVPALKSHALATIGRWSLRRLVALLLVASLAFYSLARHERVSLKTVWSWHANQRARVARSF
jgi:hypothetical protein